VHIFNDLRPHSTETRNDSCRGRWYPDSMTESHRHPHRRGRGAHPHHKLTNGPAASKAPKTRRHPLHVRDRARPGVVLVVQLANLHHAPPAAPGDVVYICPAYNPADAAESCPQGAKCPDVHAVSLATAQEFRFHEQLAPYHSVAQVPYPRFPPGFDLEVAEPNATDVATIIPSDRALKTRALLVQRRPMCLCAHFARKGLCDLGADCEFVHEVKFTAGADLTAATADSVPLAATATQYTDEGAASTTATGACTTHASVCSVMPDVRRGPPLPVPVAHPAQESHAHEGGAPELATFAEPDEDAPPFRSPAPLKGSMTASPRHLSGAAAVRGANASTTSSHRYQHNPYCPTPRTTHASAAAGHTDFPAFSDLDENDASHTWNNSATDVANGSCASRQGLPASPSGSMAHSTTSMGRRWRHQPYNSAHGTHNAAAATAIALDTHLGSPTNTDLPLARPPRTLPPAEAR
jgi:hypothetical protein